MSSQNASTSENSARPRRRNSAPGLSMLAQGETMLWLTGGSLMICLLMILGLLAWIFIQGIATFWPGPVVRVEMLDGGPKMGEVSRSEDYQLQANSLDNAPEAVKKAGQEVLQGAPEKLVHRRLFRTGNYDLTGSHFHWISDYEIAPDGESFPEWAVVIERIEWGRFYGEPKQFIVRHVREIEGEEKTWKRWLDFLQSQQYRLSEPADQERYQEAIKTLQTRYETLRTENVKRFLAEIKPEEGKELQVLAGFQTVPWDQVQPQQDVKEVREIWSAPETIWEKFTDSHEEVRERFYERLAIDKHEIGRVNLEIHHARLAVRQVQLDDKVFIEDSAAAILAAENELGGLREALETTDTTTAEIVKQFGEEHPLSEFARQFAEALGKENQDLQTPVIDRRDASLSEVQAASPASRPAVERFVKVSREANQKTQELTRRMDALTEKNARYQLLLTTAPGPEKTLSLDEIVRAYPANRLTTSEKWGVYFSRWGEFLLDDPRAANSEGGVFPAIWGTVVMTLTMSLVVVPFGVLAALYLREYAKSGLIVSIVRIAINNLAGVPSIVFGVFGLGFFCYFVGAHIDGGAKKADVPVLPPPMWFLLLLLLAVISVSAFAASAYALSGDRSKPTRLRSLIGYAGIAAWIATTVLVLVLIVANPHFNGFYEAHLPNPKFGKSGLLWASLTLALLTLPVVIVATEEALSAVPNSLREGSYACGAGKWQTIRRIVLPHAMPGIMTGMILAMARGAGEVAPLMLVGAVQSAPELPVDGVFPFVHLDRSFMHLGFHIYDLGFHSPNSEAAKPMVYITTQLLIFLIAVLTIFAAWVRGRLRRRFSSNAF